AESSSPAFRTSSSRCGRHSSLNAPAYSKSASAAPPLTKPSRAIGCGLRHWSRTGSERWSLLEAARPTLNAERRTLNFEVGHEGRWGSDLRAGLFGFRIARERSYANRPARRSGPTSLPFFSVQSSAFCVLPQAALPVPVSLAESDALSSGHHTLRTGRMPQRCGGGTHAKFERTRHWPLFMQTEQHTGREGIARSGSTLYVCGGHAHAGLPERFPSGA